MGLVGPMLLLGLACGDPTEPQVPPSGEPVLPFAVEDRVIGSPDHLYLDPEINPEDRLMVFQDEDETIWVGELDPQTGLFVSGHGRDQPWDAPTVTQLTHEDTDRGGNVPTQDASAETTWVALHRRLGNTYYGGYLDVREPGMLHPVPGVVAYQDPFAIAIRPQANASVFIAGVIQNGKTQVAWIDPRSGDFRLLTDDLIGKYDAWAFRAPELDGDVALLANLEYGAVGIYRDVGTAAWAQVTTLTMPPGSSHRRVRSAEPLTVGGATWVTLEAFDPGDDLNTSIWILGWGEDPRARVARRVDGGAGAPGRVYRGDPEVFIGASEVFVYYNLNDFGGRRELHRCRSGVFR